MEKEKTRANPEKNMFHFKGTQPPIPPDRPASSHLGGIIVWSRLWMSEKVSFRWEFGEKQFEFQQYALELF